MDWRIYYSKSTFCSDDGPPESASGYDIQVIVQPPIDGAANPTLLQLTDWYYYRTDSQEWVGGDLQGVLDLLLAREPIVAISQGRRIPKAQFSEILATAKYDLDFPRTSGTIERP